MAGKKVEPLPVVHRDCAGVDVGKRKHYVAVDPGVLLPAKEVPRRLGQDVQALMDNEDPRPLQ